MEKKTKVKKIKKKINKLNLISVIVTVIAILMLLGVLVGSVGFMSLIKGRPELNIDDFNPTESTIILDKDDNQIAELGSVIRQNVEYNDLPTSLIDAFVAVEDSRYFEHNGFDLPRFTKALITNIRSMSFGSGASTFTMQLVKNTYFVNDDAGTGATKSLQRKAQEIVLAMQLEKQSTKKEIFTNYINKLNFGGTSQNIRGVQKAAQYYFGKDVIDLTLPESAMLAGVINAPNAYNPYNNLKLAQERRDQVLYLMKYHGYINETEYELALKTNVEDFLVDSSLNKNNGDGSIGTPYQAYVDAVVDEVYSLTGLDPYTTGMVIHTYMNKDIQDLIDDIQAGNTDVFTYPDENFELGSVCINNRTGEVIGILGGRNYSRGGSLLLNHATYQKKQPGSSIKPLLVYSQAFEVLGWSTSHVVEDRPLKYIGTDIPIGNSNNTFAGQVTLKYAIGMSLNTPAISTIRELQEAKGDAYLVSYLQSLGFNIDANDFDEQYAIGGKGLQVTCEQLAGAYAAMLNGGNFIAPHTVKKIEFMSDRESITPSYTSKSVISEQAAFLTDEMLKNNVEGGYPNLMGIFRDDYDVYAKTGTTNYGSEGGDYGIPNGAMKDGWVVAGSSEYTVATWTGYEKMQKDKISYMPASVYNINIKGKVTNLILDKTVELYGEPNDITKPSGISNITHIIATLPYAATVDGMDDEYITSGLIKSDSKYAKLVSAKTANIADMTGSPSADLKGYELSLSWPEYPNKDQLEDHDDTYDISLKKSDGSILVGATGTRLFDYSWLYGTVVYKADVYVDNSKIDTLVSTDGHTSLDIKSALRSSGSNNPKIEVEFYYAFKESDKKSNSKSVELTANTALSIKLPATQDANEIINYLKGILGDDKVSTNVVSTNTSSDNGKVESIKIYKSSSDSAGTTYSAGNASSIEVNAFSAKAVVNIYSYKATISISETASSVIASTNAPDDTEVKWYITHIDDTTSTETTTVTSGSSSLDISDYKSIYAVIDVNNETTQSNIINK